MNAKFSKTLLVAAMGVFAIAANAQNNTPRDNPAGTSTTNTTQQGTTTGTTNSTAPAGAMNNGMANHGMMKYRRLSDDDMGKYKSGWAACAKMSGADQTTCHTKFASSWSQVDPKCQKVSGNALDDCLKGADHGQ